MVNAIVLLFGILAQVMLLTLAQPVELDTVADKAQFERDLFDAYDEALSKRASDNSTGAIYNPPNGCSLGDRLLLKGLHDHTKGNGDPYQAYHHHQMGEQVACGKGKCQATVSKGYSYTVSWSFDFGFGLDDPEKGIGGFFDGGFSVSQSWTEDQSYTCDGTEGQIVCVWYITAVTQYAVGRVVTQDVTDGAPACKDNGKIVNVGIMSSPNTDNLGGRYYCRYSNDHCPAIGTEFFKPKECKGGPQTYCGGDDP